MPAVFHLGMLLCWAVVLGYWAITALRAKQVTRSESRARQFLAYWLPLIIAILLLGPGHWFGHGWLREQFVPHSLPIYALGLLLLWPVPHSRCGRAGSWAATGVAMCRSSRHTS